MASQLTSFTSVYSTVYSGADQRKHQSSASLAFVRGIHWWPVNSPHKWPVKGKMFPFDDVIMLKRKPTNLRLAYIHWDMLEPCITVHQVANLHAPNHYAHLTLIAKQNTNSRRIQWCFTTLCDKRAISFVLSCFFGWKQHLHPMVRFIKNRWAYFIDEERLFNFLHELCLCWFIVDVPSCLVMPRISRKNRFKCWDFHTSFWGVKKYISWGIKFVTSSSWFK